MQRNTNRTRSEQMNKIVIGSYTQYILELHICGELENCMDNVYSQRIRLVNRICTSGTQVAGLSNQATFRPSYFPNCRPYITPINQSYLCIVNTIQKSADANITFSLYSTKKTHSVV